MQLSIKVQRSLLLRVLSVCVVLVSLGGCGFALRGTADLPPEIQTLQLESVNANSEVAREMRRALRNNDVEVVDTADAGIYRLGIGQEQISERVLSVNANARAGEYELTMRLPFQLWQDAMPVLGPETLEVSRIYLADPENAVAKNEETELIRSEMRRELAQQILRRLQAVEL